MKTSRYPFAPLVRVRPTMLSVAAFMAGCAATPPRSKDFAQKHQVMVDLEERMMLDFEAVAS